MQHCVFEFLDTMRDGSLLPLSVRRADKPGERLATAEPLGKDRDWHVGHVAGFANEEVDPSIHQAVAFLAELLNGSGW